MFRESQWVKTWAEALRLLDRYRWVRLIPTEVHAEFREDVFVEATRRPGPLQPPELREGGEEPS